MKRDLAAKVRGKSTSKIQNMKLLSCEESAIGKNSSFNSAISSGDRRRRPKITTSRGGVQMRSREASMLKQRKWSYPTSESIYQCLLSHAPWTFEESGIYYGLKQDQINECGEDVLDMN